jgi:adenylate kinase
VTTKSPLFLVLFGAQGSGKGTQARLLQDEFGLPQIATGDLFRYNLKNETELGLLAKSYMDRGELVPDEVTNAMVRERLGRPDCAVGAVFDGYPRNIAQAKALDGMLMELNSRIHRAIYIKVGTEELMRRITGRRVCRQCQASYHVVFNPPKVEGVCDRCGGQVYQRDDDKNEAALARRLEIYFEETMPVIDFYRERGVLTEINGQQEIDNVNAALRSVITG